MSCELVWSDSKKFENEKFVGRTKCAYQLTPHLCLGLVSHFDISCGELDPPEPLTECCGQVASWCM